MNILMISKDRDILTEGSPVRLRMEEYARYTDHLFIIVLNAKGKVLEGEKLSLYPAGHIIPHLAPLSAVSEGKKLFKKKTIDVITTQDPFETGWVGHTLSKRYGKPLHVQVHTDIGSPHFATSHMLNRVRIQIAKKVIPHAKAIRAVSERVKQGIERHFASRAPISILPTLVMERIYEGEAEGYPYPFTILLLGRFEKEKRYEDAIHVLGALTHQYPALGLCIVGTGREEKSLKALAQRLGVSKKITFVPWVDDVGSVLRKSHVLLVTSSYEGYGRIFLEATDAKLPIISTRVGIIDDVLKSGVSVLSCEVGDTSCMGSHIVKLLNENHTRRELVLHASEEIKKHRATYQEYAKKIIDDIARAL